METRNYYVVLGIDPRESSHAIRSAFRELVHRYHPDRAGSLGQPFFQDIVEAYRVLADPERRASYDAGLRDGGERAVAPRRPITPAAWPQPEPLAPAPISLFHDFAVRRPGLEEVATRFRRSFTHPDLPKSQRPEALRLEVVLPPDRAARGGLFELTVPVFYPCRSCHGARAIGPFSCRRCNGQGMEEHEELVQLSVPARLRDGAVFALPLRGLGIHGLFLELMFRVGGLRD
ncbi:MAG TPA: DnaJ domain-containing protein [Myxococcaceae bacterium]|nr:DnaJ domain-containing protein [Myxococcaceae bacterium]